MSPSPGRDLVVGAFVLAGLLALGWLSLTVGGIEFESGNQLVLRARFDELGGLKTRAPVVISGVRVGKAAERQNFFLVYVGNRHLGSGDQIIVQ